MPYTLRLSLHRRGSTSCCWLIGVIARSTLQYLAPQEAPRERVDQTTGSSPPLTTQLAQDTMSLPGLAVAIVTLPK